jgi:hypothetical protein
MIIPAKGADKLDFFALMEIHVSFPDAVCIGRALRIASSAARRESATTRVDCAKIRAASERLRLEIQKQRESSTKPYAQVVWLERYT